MILVMQNSVHRDCRIAWACFEACCNQANRNFETSPAPLPRDRLLLVGFTSSREHSMTYGVKMVASCPLSVILLLGLRQCSVWCRFFMYTLVITLQHYMAVSMFRMAGAVTQNMITAYTAGAFLMLICFLLGGFLIAKRKALFYLQSCPTCCRS